MEAFEHLVKVVLELDDFVVAGPLKFAVRRRTRKASHSEHQTHGYEIDLVGARRELLVLASVKSYLGSLGVNRQGFTRIADRQKRTHFPRYRIFNDSRLRSSVASLAAKRYGYPISRVELRLYVGKFKPADEELVRRHLGSVCIGCRPVKVVGLREMEPILMRALRKKTYINDPVIVTLKAMHALGRLPIEADNDG